MNLKLRFLFLLYYFSSFSAYFCSSTSTIDLESGHRLFDIVGLSHLDRFNYDYDNEHGNSIDTVSDSDSSGTNDVNVVSVTSERRTSDYNGLYDHHLIPLPQHMASFPTWFLILYLAKFITDPAIYIQVFNFFAVFVLTLYIQRFFGYEVVLNLRNFPCFVQLERIDFGPEGEEVVTDLSRWVLLPFAWFTEILLIHHDDIKSSLNYFTYIPDKSTILILFIVQLLYIYSCQPVLTRTRVR